MKSKNNAELLVLATVLIGTFLGSIDRTIVNLATPKIMRDFGVNVSKVGWILTVYIISNAVFVPVWGKLGDTIGRKKVYLTGLSIFTISSLLLGFSWSFGSILVFRIMQGIAVSADYPTAMAILTVTFTDNKKRAQALGVWSAGMASGAVIGPLIGGPLIDFLGWRSVFFVNIPLGLMGILMAKTFIKESSLKKTNEKFDILGAILLGIALSALVLVLDRGQEWGWTSAKSIIMYIITGIFSVLVYFVEKKQKEPVVNFKFFKNKTFTLALLNTFVVFMGMMGTIFLIPLFAQLFLGYSATKTGYLFIPMALTLMVSAPLSARFTRKIQPGKIIAIGSIIAAGGMFLFYFLDPRSTVIDLIFPLIILAFGLGIGMPYRTNIIASSVPKEEVGVASSLFVMFRNISGAFGIALFSTILSHKIESNLLKTAQNSFLNVHSLTTYKEFISLIILKAQISSYAEVFAIASGLMIIGAVFAWFIRVKKNN